ncbi:MAG: STN domain-containing protein [Steroidobacteraceae bacterium]
MRLAVVATAIYLAIVGLANADDAKAAIRKPTDIPAQGLGPALTSLAKEFEFQVLYRTEVVGKLRTQGASGAMTAAEALEHVLSGTGLTYRYLDDKTVTIVPLSTGQGANSLQDGRVPSGGVGSSQDTKSREGADSKVSTDMQN